MGNPGYKKDAGKKPKPQKDGMKMYLEEVDDRKHFLTGGPSTTQNIEKDTQRRIEAFDRTWAAGKNPNGNEMLLMTHPFSDQVTLMIHTESFWNPIGPLGLRRPERYRARVDEQA